MLAQRRCAWRVRLSRVVEETLVSGAVVSDVARLHGLTQQQVFRWRRQAREAVATTESKTPQFVRAIAALAFRTRGAISVPNKTVTVTLKSRLAEGSHIDIVINH
jgi:transposase-like protein